MSQFTSTIRNGTLWIGVRFVLAGILGLITMPLIARYLSVKDYGIYNLLFSIVWYIAVLSAFGITNIFQRYIPEANIEKNYGLIKNLVFKGMILRLILSSIVVFIIIMFSDRIGRLFKIEDWCQYFTYFGIGIVLFLEMSLLSVAMQGLFLHKYISLANIMCTILRAVGLCFVLLTHKGLQGVLWIEIISWTVNLGLLLIAYHIMFLSKHRNMDLSPIPMKKFISYGGYSFFSEIGFAVFSSATDLLIITIYLGPISAGLYGLCDRVIMLFQRVLPNSVLREMIIPVFFSRFAQEKDYRELNKMFNFLVKANLFFTLPLAGTICALGSKIIPLVFGDKYNESYATMCVVVGFYVLNSTGQPIENTLRAIEKVNIVFWAQLFAVFNLVGALLVVQPFGILGVAWVTSISVLSKNIFCFYHAKKNAHLTLELKGLLVILVNSLLPILVFCLVKEWVDSHISLAAIVLSGGILYLLACYLNPFLNEDEKQFVLKITPIKTWMK